MFSFGTVPELFIPFKVSVLDHVLLFNTHCLATISITYFPHRKTSLCYLHQFHSTYLSCLIKSNPMRVNNDVTHRDIYYKARVYCRKNKQEVQYRHTVVHTAPPCVCEGRGVWSGLCPKSPTLQRAEDRGLGQNRPPHRNNTSKRAFIHSMYTIIIIIIISLCVCVCV